MHARRTVILGGALTIFSELTCFCSAKDNIQGCAISINVAKNYLSNDDFNISIVSQSGNSEFDYAAAQTLSKLTDIFSVLPGFLYFKNNSNNAFATNGKLTQANDGTILFGRDLLFNILQEPEAPDAIFSGICAHEFAHILQFNRGVDLNKNQPTAKRGELHADFLAGYFAGLRKIEKPSFPAAVIAVTHEKYGDYDFNNPQHHGTPAERSDAIVQGFNAGFVRHINPMAAFEEGIKYVTELR
jgi:hypothetical protein